MNTLQKLGYVVRFANLSDGTPWAVFPMRKVVLLQDGLPPSHYPRIIREAVISVPQGS